MKFMNCRKYLTTISLKTTMAYQESIQMIEHIETDGETRQNVAAKFSLFKIFMRIFNTHV